MVIGDNNRSSDTNLLGSNTATCHFSMLNAPLPCIKDKAAETTVSQYVLVVIHPGHLFIRYQATSYYVQVPLRDTNLGTGEAHGGVRLAKSKRRSLKMDQKWSSTSRIPPHASQYFIAKRQS